MTAIIKKTELPGPQSMALMERRKQSVARGPFHTTPIFVAEARGALIKDVDGNTLIDLSSGIGVTNVGHTNDRVVAKVSQQLKKYLHTSFNIIPYEPYLQVCEKLNEVVPIVGSKKTYLANSGAEAVENAIKIARIHTKRQAVVCFDHAFHGRTYMAMTLTAKAKPYKDGMAPFCPEVYRVPYPYQYRWSAQQALTEDQIALECFEQFQHTLTTQIGADKVAAVILEPVVGEGGFIVAPKLFLKKLREFCDQNKIVLIADEIQTGFGRTGKWFACEALEFKPDLITLAKGLGGGLPLSAVVGKAEIMDAPAEGTIGGTYGGNPLSCVAALAVFEELASPQFLEHIQLIAETLKNRLQQMAQHCSAVGEVRGLGAMLALELVKNRQTKEPNKELTAQLVKYCYSNGVVLLSAGTFSNVIRFLMPLTITELQLNEALDVVEAGLKKLWP